MPQNMRREREKKKEKEDSGVNLEDPLSPDYSASWDIKSSARHGHFANFVIPGCFSIPPPSADSMSQSGDRDIGHLTAELQSHCKTSQSSKKHPKPEAEAQPMPKTMVVQTKESLLASRCSVDKQKPQVTSQTPRISVASSASQPIIHHREFTHCDETQAEPLLQKASGNSQTESSSKSMVSKLKKLPIPRRKHRKADKGGRGRRGMGLSPPITPESKSDCTAYATFSFGSDSETEDSATGGFLNYSLCAANVVGGSGEATPPYGVTATAASKAVDVSSVTAAAMPSSSRERKRDRNKSRFKKILRPIRRSHSAGCAKDVPAHALFLSQQASEERGERQSVDTGRGSMDRSGSGSDSENDNNTPEKRSSVKPKKKSLAQEMKDKLAFLRRRHTDSSLPSKEMSKTSPEAALEWSKAFENLLHDRNGLELFREFLRTEFSDENVEFWVACEEYKKLKTSNYNPIAQRIYTDYVAIQAPREVNLDSKTRLTTAENLNSPGRTTFEVAQKRIQALMEKDSYPRFLQSPVYQDILGDQRHKLKLKS